MSLAWSGNMEIIIPIGWRRERSSAIYRITKEKLYTPSCGIALKFHSWPLLFSILHSNKAAFPIALTITPLQLNFQSSNICFDITYKFLHIFKDYDVVFY